MPALIPAAIMGGTSLLGGIFGSKSAKNAAAEQSQAGIGVAHQIEKSTADAISRGETGMSDALQNLDTGVGNANGVIDQKLGDSLSTLNSHYTDANTNLRSALDQTRTDLNPYMNLGAQGLTGMSDLMNPAKAQQALTLDPGYQFRMNEALKALGNSAAGRGAALGGGAAKALTRYSSDYASNEYQKVFDRYGTMANYGQHATDQAVNANMTTGARLSANDMSAGEQSANLWQKAGQQQSGNLMDWSRLRAATDLSGNQWIGEMGLKGADLAGGYYTGAANARAAGDIRAGNAWGNAFSGLAGAAGSYFMNQQSPTTPPFLPGGIPGLDTNVATQPARP